MVGKDFVTNCTEIGFLVASGTLNQGENRF